jgi:hypothetical protein
MEKNSRKKECKQNISVAEEKIKIPRKYKRDLKQEHAIFFSCTPSQNRK